LLPICPLPGLKKCVVLEYTLPENQVLFPEAFRLELDTPPQKTAFQTHRRIAVCFVNICAKNSTITSIVLHLVHPVKTYLDKVILSKNQCDKPFAIPIRLFWHNDCSKRPDLSQLKRPPPFSGLRRFRMIFIPLQLCGQPQSILHRFEDITLRGGLI
jgi:hypothetical protein